MSLPHMPSMAKNINLREKPFAQRLEMIADPETYLLREDWISNTIREFQKSLFSRFENVSAFKAVCFFQDRSS